MAVKLQLFLENKTLQIPPPIAPTTSSTLVNKSIFSVVVMFSVNTSVKPFSTKKSTKESSLTNLRLVV